MTCSSCRVNFCTYCVSNKLLEQDNCPNCYEQKPKMVSMQRNLSRALQRIRITCRVGDGPESRGCDQEVKVGDFVRHRQSECSEKCEACHDKASARARQVEEIIPRYA